ncbi:hypothetical protein [Sphingomicrobium clamense]|uniref:Uncharacterized protein n=1 Tax=Sphingomicrobium clamense TaxID=2851013 RepID=A0ABS6V5A4_9SPHN|nr:hypothetical protein [Sphingomicrobium sp. B8]MBW0144733.1 hypothetical protein [Sphingomicrobium sp. B8]
MILAALSLLVQQVPMLETASGVPTANGQWRIVEQGSVVSARFGNLVDLSCYRSNKVLRLAVSDPAQPLAPLPTRLLVSTTYGDRWVEHPAPLHVRDPLGDWMAYSRGRILLMPEGAAPVIVPNHAEVARVIEACRS